MAKTDDGISEEKGRITVEEAGKMGGQRERELVEEGHEQEGGGKKKKPEDEEGMDWQ
jgi:hypothetical protein